MLPDAITGIGSMPELSSHAKSGEVLELNGLKGVVDGFMGTPMALNTLNNYPDFFKETNMAEIDVKRDRQRGVGRYNRFLKALGLPVKKEWADFSSNVGVQEKLASIYQDVDKVDMQVPVKYIKRCAQGRACPEPDPRRQRTDTPLTSGENRQQSVCDMKMCSRQSSRFNINTHFPH